MNGVPDPKWSDDTFLDGLRRQADAAADATIERLVAEHGEAAVGPIFKLLQANDTPLPADAPAPLHEFLARTGGLPADADPVRLQRGGNAFLKNAVPSVIVLLASSLPRGYAAPCLTEILSISGDLRRHPYDRLMGVVQLLINISDGDAFAPRGRAIVTAQKLRLLHAGIRRLTRKYRPDYLRRFGMPVNHEDMLATIMGFSFLLVDGVRRLSLPLTAEEAEDLYYVWHTFARLMGIHPDGEPDATAWVPATLTDAAAFYASYVRRNDTMPERNAYGVLLTKGNVRMMRQLMPLWLRLLGGGLAPRICMTELMAVDELARVGYRPLPGHRLLKAVLSLVLRAGRDAGRDLSFAGDLARHVLQGMVDVDRRGEVEFAIPFSRLGLRGRDFE
jgi:ER-bound oxygenase mpaB/B'/Rubber oxygenase, catalytic domain